MKVPPEEIRHLRCDLHGLVALEVLQLALGGSALVAISVRAAWLAEDLATAVGIAVTVILALTYIAMAFRIRMGQDLVRRDLQRMELHNELDVDEAEHRCHPYRTTSR